MKFIISRDKPALIYKGTEISYKELVRRILYYSNMLKLEHPEDKVLIFLENRPEIAYAIFSIWERKGISINVDAGSNAIEIAYFLTDAKPKYLYTSNKNLEVAVEALKISGLNIPIINLDEVKVPEKYVGKKDYIEAPMGDSTVLLLYTSGTTGDPKGVMLTMDNLLSNIDNIAKVGLYREIDRVLALLPMHHILPLMGNLILPIKIGGTVIILDDLSSTAIKGALQKYKITLFVGVPRLWEMFHKGIMEKINSSFIPRTLFKIVAKTNNIELGRKIFKKVQDGFGGEMHVMVSGGAKIDPQIIKDFNTLGFRMLEGYGLTETSPILTFTRYGDIRPGSCGGALPGVELKIADDGEIIARGKNIMKGYYNKPKATAEVIDKDGWFHTGDLGEIRDTYLYIVGRKKEMIVLPNGKNINPQDIEDNIMKRTNLISELAITEHKSHLVAIVYPNFSVIEQEGIKNISEAIKWNVVDPYNIEAPNYRKILDIKIVQEELPKTRLGKLRRFKLKDLLEEKKRVIEKIAEPTIEEYLILKKFIENLKGISSTPKDHFELDLGMDSLDFVELLSFVENTFNITIMEEELSQYPTLYDLSKFLHDKGVNITEKENNWSKILNKDIDVFIPKSSVSLKFTKFILTPFFKGYIKINKSGLENIINQPAIFIGNHQSMLDAFILINALNKKILKDTYYLAVSKHFKGSFKKWGADHGNIILLDVDNNLSKTLQAAAMVLRQGKNLVIFPEGARSRDGEMTEFKKAFAILSKTLNIPIQPFVIDGAYKSMPIGSKFPKSTDVDLTFLPPLYPKDLEIDEIVIKSEGLIKKQLKNS
ncbi:MAG: long-chain fatty acid--CoA ligase [Fusobacteriia bacterium 4572_74]|nr:MAG: long-chain fatty acid--CoA ligase [Fusobacteriia bacterium 4572_74]